MTREQLTAIEAALQKRGYRKWTQALTDSESWAWFKTFAEERDEDGDPVSGYQVAFRVWDNTRYGETDANAYGLDVWSSPIGTDGRADLTANWEPVCDIATFERMAAEFHLLTRKYIKQ